MRNLPSKKLYIAVIAIIFIIFFYSQQPSNNRDWTQDQKILPYAEFLKDDKILVRNIRNFEYRSTSDYTPNYYNKTFDLNKLTSVDYLVEPFGSIGAAHTFISFGFKGTDFVSISVEIRKEKEEEFSPIKGVLKQYELMYVIADEKDVVALRTNHRKDPVYLYPIKTTQEKMQILFLNMLKRANKLKETPEFYNTLTNTCTTNIANHVNEITPNKIPWDIRLLLPENSDELAYEIGLIDNSLTLEQSRKKYLINDRAKLYANDPNFSIKIRE